jgi:hypothetical protein
LIHLTKIDSPIRSSFSNFLDAQLGQMGHRRKGLLMMQIRAARHLHILS